MSTVISSFVTLTCDAPECDKNVTFPQTPEGEKQAITENPWINSLRSIQTVDNRKFTYCSDSCEAKGVGQGTHNQKTLVAPQGPNAVELAAQAAARAQLATAKLKAGESVTLS